MNGLGDSVTETFGLYWPSTSLDGDCSQPETSPEVTGGKDTILDENFNYPKEQLLRAKSVMMQALKAKYPGGEILDENLEYCGTKQISFAGPELGEPQKNIHQPTFEVGYILSFKFYGYNYELVERDGIFTSAELSLTIYPEVVLTEGLKHLSKKYDTVINSLDIVVKRIEIVTSYPNPALACRGDFESLRQEPEKQYVLSIEYKGKSDIIILSAQGEFRGMAL